MSLTSRGFTFLASLFGLLMASAAHADLATCQAKCKEAVENCQNAANQVESAKNAASGSVSSGSGQMGNSVRGFSLEGVTKDGAAMDNAGKNYCQPLKASNCDAPCTQGISDKEKPMADQAKQNCDKSIDDQVAKFTQSAQNLTGNSKDSGNTGNQAAGMPAMTPPSPSSPSATPSTTPAPATPTPSTPAASTTPATTPPATTPATAGFSGCSGDQAYLYDKCATQLLSQCNGNFHSSGVCESFSSRYCSTGAESSASSGALKAGEGIGSPYCQSFLSANSSFACNTATASCPSCSHVAAVAGAVVPDACKLDPAFANPSFAQAVAASSGGAAGGSSGGSSGSAVGGGVFSDIKLPTDQPKRGGPESSNREGLSLAVDAGGGGGGGSSAGNTYTIPDFSMRKPAAAKRNVASTAGSMQVMSVASDVEGRGGPSVFSISTEILRHRCQRGKLMHCGADGK